MISDTPKVAEAAVIACLSAQDVPVSAETRKAGQTVPPAYVRVTRTGGNGMVNPVTDHALLLVECWAPSELQAAQLAATCRGLLGKADGRSFADVFVRWARPQGQVSFADETGPRHQFLVELLVGTQ